MRLVLHPFRISIACLLFPLLVLSVWAVAAEENSLNSARALAGAFRQAIEKVKPAVVSISAEKKAEKVKAPDMSEIPDIFKRLLPPDMFKDQMIPKQGWQGSGVIISPTGEILTNNHVVKDADKLTVTLDDGRDMSAKVVATDIGTDIALIQLQEPGPYAFAVLGDSDQLSVGDWVLAIGNPFGLSQSVSEGIVSAKGRTNKEVPVGSIDGFRFKDFIQTTAAINLGNSGGPLITIDGEVIGVNNAIQTIAGIPANVGIGFAIPSNLAKSVIQSLKEYGKVRRGYLGVELNPEMPEYFAQQYNLKHGALVKHVFPNTPAEKAGIKHGDLIVKINGTQIKDNDHLIKMITATPIGTEIEVVVFRQGEEVALKMTVMERPADEELAVGVGKTQSRTLLGMEVETLTPERAKEKGFEEDLQGVIVTQVDAGGPAQEVGIHPDEVISEVNNRAIESKEQFEKIITDFVEAMIQKNQKDPVAMFFIHRTKNRISTQYIGLTIRLDPEKDKKKAPEKSESNKSEKHSKSE